MKTNPLQRYLFLTLIAISLWHCQPTSTPADIIYENGVIWTGDAATPQATALAVRGDSLVYVGDDPKAWKGPNTQVVDLQGAFVTPGFIDNHTHFFMGGFQLASVNLRNAKTPAEFIQRIADFAKSLEPGQWILNGDWDHENWGGELPRKEWIDSVTTRNPVFVTRMDGHMSLANSQALELAGITRSTSAIAGGTIIRDAQGVPTGILKDEAMNPVFRVIPAPSDAEMDEALRRAMDHAVSLGVTQINDVGSFGGWPDLATFRRARAKDALKIRVYSLVTLASWRRLDSLVTTEGRGDHWLHWGGLKGFVDGSLGSTTAWFYDPYVDEPETSGLLVNDTAALRQWIIQADSAQLQVAVHAIGDRANDWLLQVYALAAQRNGPRDRRFRIEHAQHLTREAIRQFASQGVVPSMQPYHAIDDGRWAAKRIGPERILTTYAFRSLLDAGAPLTFGSDWTVAPISPLQGIYAAVTRQTLDGANPGGWVPGEKITVEEALRCYTANNAYAAFMEGKTGVLKAGMLADFVVLGQNLLTIAPEDIKKVPILRTVVGGKTMFEASK
ncbi:MAG: amidohydrolase [Lewinellaceae bacterium]|nr:amidohydrolase [Lewinellaceae bacterium]